MAKLIPTELGEKCVLLVLADIANDDGECFIGYERLMEYTSIKSKSSVSKYLDILVGAGLIAKKSHAVVGYGRKVNRYKLLFSADWFEHRQDEMAKSTRIVLAESTRLELIEKINKLHVNKKRAISTHLEPGKVHTSNPKSTHRGHEPSVLTTSNEPPVYTYTPDQNKKPAKQKRECKRSIPDDFSISAGVKNWYQENDFPEPLETHFENFVLVAEAKGYQYANWDAALKNAIRNDWAGLRKNKYNGGNTSAKAKANENFSERNYGESDINLPGFCCVD